MSSDTVRPGRHERRAAALAARRAERRRPTATRRPSALITVSVTALLAGMAIIAVLAFARSQPTSEPSVVAASGPAGLVNDGTILGRKDAPIAIDLYEDFQCPACLRWGADVFPSLARNELASGRARLVFHGYPFIGPESRDAEKAAWAAGQQGRFWDMWATLYANQGLRENAGAFSRDRLFAMADAIGLDGGQFAHDFDAPGAAAAVSDGIREANSAGIQSTPSLRVNGNTLVGATYPDLAAAIAAAGT